MKRKLILTLAATLATTALMAQENNNDDKITLSGSIQSDVIIPQEDKKIGTCLLYTSPSPRDA